MFCSKALKNVGFVFMLDKKQCNHGIKFKLFL